MKLKRNKFFKFFSILIISAMIMTILGPMTISAAGSDSQYLSLGSDTTVTGTTTILTKTITFSSATKVYISSAGRYFSSSNICAGMQLKVDSEYIGNASILDWSSSSLKAQHSYDCVAGVTVGAGTHTFSLVAKYYSGAGNLMIGAGSNLSIMTNVTVDMQMDTLGSDSQIYNFTTNGIQPGTPIPHSKILSCTVNPSSGPIIAMGSGRVIYGNHDGDAMLGIFCDGNSLPNNEGQWTVNDIWGPAELHAPIFCHAYIKKSGSHNISLEASELPWRTVDGENPCQYKVGSSTALVVLAGEQVVSGSAANNSDTWNTIDYQFVGDGSGSGFGTTLDLATENVYIPSDHNGVVFFDAKIKMQPNGTNQTGIARLWIEIDGVPCGSAGVQEVISPNNISERTLCATYMSAGSNALKPGNHTVKVRTSCSGFPNYVLGETSLVWFDGQAGTKATPGENLVTNPGFFPALNVNGISGWFLGGSNPGASYIEDGGRNGTAMTHWSTSAYSTYTGQTITGLKNGLYTMKAWVYSPEGNLGTAFMTAKEYGGQEMTASIPKTSEWTQITISNINVTNGQCTVGFWSNSPAISWYKADDVEFYKQ